MVCRLSAAACLSCFLYAAGRPSPHRRTSSIGIPRTLSAIAARVPGFGRRLPSALPSTPEDGPGLLGSSESPKPDVPSVLLTNHSTG